MERERSEALVRANGAPISWTAAHKSLSRGPLDDLGSDEIYDVLRRYRSAAIVTQRRRASSFQPAMTIWNFTEKDSFICATRTTRRSNYRYTDDFTMLNSVWELAVVISLFRIRCGGIWWKILLAMVDESLDGALFSGRNRWWSFEYFTSRLLVEDLYIDFYKLTTLIGERLRWIFDLITFHSVLHFKLTDMICVRRLWISNNELHYISWTY